MKSASRRSFPTSERLPAPLDLHCHRRACPLRLRVSARQVLPQTRLRRYLRRLAPLMSDSASVAVGRRLTMPHSRKRSPRRRGTLRPRSVKMGGGRQALEATDRIRARVRARKRAEAASESVSTELSPRRSGEWILKSKSYRRDHARHGPRLARSGRLSGRRAKGPRLADEESEGYGKTVGSTQLSRTIGADDRLPVDIARRVHQRTTCFQGRVRSGRHSRRAPGRFARLDFATIARSRLGGSDARPRL